MAKAVGKAKVAAAAEAKATEVVKAASDLSLDKVTQKISGTQVEIQRALTTVSAKLAEQLQDLGNVEAAIIVKKAELKSLHDIEVGADSLTKLQAEIETAREQWTEEKRRQATDRAREEEQYNYETTLKRRKAEADFADKLAAQQKLEASRKELLEKQWADREAALKAREAEFATLVAQVNGFPEVLKKEVAKAEAIVGNSLKRDYEHKLALTLKDVEIEKRAAEQTIAGLNGKVTDLQSQVKRLEDQNVKAQETIRDISNKVSDSASGRQTIDALREVVMNKDTGPIAPGRR